MLALCCWGEKFCHGDGDVLDFDVTAPSVAPGDALSGFLFCSCWRFLSFCDILGVALGVA